MAAVRGIFSISDATFLKKNNYWTNLSDVWADQIPNNGYFGGGFTTVAVSTMDKILYSTDTRSTIFSAPLNVSDYYISSIASSNSGYFGGGLLSSLFTKVNYSLDNTLAVPGVALSIARYGLGATGNSTAGYFGGGFPPAVPSFAVSTMDKLTYSTDTTSAVPTAALSNGRGNLAASASTTAGYFGGGSSQSMTVLYGTTDKLTYSTETTVAIPTGVLSQQRYGLGATGSTTAGYFGGGFTSPSQQTSTMDKVTYSSDTRSSVLTGRLLTSRGFLSATGNSSSGYFAGGGFPSPVAARYDLIEKLSFSTETQLDLSFIPAGGTGARLSSTKYGHAASSAKANALTQNNWRRFSDGSTTTNPASLPPATPTPSSLNVSVSTPNTGYFAGGIAVPGTVSTVDKLTYSTETTVAVPGAPLSTSLSGNGGVGNSLSGYFLASKTIVQKVTYSTDTRSTTPFFPAGSDFYRGNGAGTGNETAGYLGGGLAPVPSFPASLDDTTSVTRISYITESWNDFPGALSLQRNNMAATGNNNFGYFCGGVKNSAPNPGPKSIVERLTYSNNTFEVLPSTSLSIARNGLSGGVGDSSVGYFGGGGNFPAYYSTMDKLTYSTETLTSIPTALLSGGRSALASTGNITSGYFSGGFDGTNRLSTTDRVTYSTDTRTTIASAALSIGRNSFGATSARSNNLPQPTYTLVYRNIV